MTQDTMTVEEAHLINQLQERIAQLQTELKEKQSKIQWYEGRLSTMESNCREIDQELDNFYLLMLRKTERPWKEVEKIVDLLEENRQ